MEGWQGQRVALPLRPAPTDGQPRPPAVGVDWGYAGAAPRELARALLADCFGRKWANHSALVEAVLAEVVATLAKSGWELSERDLAAWAHAWALQHADRELAALAELLYVRLSTTGAPAS